MLASDYITDRQDAWVVTFVHGNCKYNIMVNIMPYRGFVRLRLPCLMRADAPSISSHLKAFASISSHHSISSAITTSSPPASLFGPAGPIDERLFSFKLWLNCSDHANSSPCVQDGREVKVIDAAQRHESVGCHLPKTDKHDSELAACMGSATCRSPPHPAAVLRTVPD